MVNTATIDLICEFEGFVPTWYPDPAHGWKVPTCCYGHTDAAGEPKFAESKTRRFSEAEGREILARDLEAVVRQVKSLVKVELNSNELGGLVSFVFNVGWGNFAKSTLLRKLNSGDRAGAAREFARWNRAAGKVLKGLSRRRAAETELFLRPPSSTVPVESTSAPDAPLNWFVRLLEWLFSRGH